MRKFVLWGPALIFLIIISAMLLEKSALVGANIASLKITNRTASEITDIRVAIHDEPCEFKRVLAGDSIVCDLVIEADGHYTVSWNEARAGNYREQAGYVTRGLDFNHELDFLGDGKVDFRFVENY